MKEKMLKELVLQSLAHERGGVQIYETALECVRRKDLRTEWEEYLDQTMTHVEILQRICAELQIDPDEETPGTRVAGHLGTALVEAMKMAKKEADAAAAEIVAAECVVLAETKDHADWQLLSKCVEHLQGPRKKTMKDAVEEVEDEEDEHLYHTTGWCRELWLESLGLESEFPPPEERKNVKTAIGAARAQHASEHAR